MFTTYSRRRTSPALRLQQLEGRDLMDATPLVVVATTQMAAISPAQPVQTSPLSLTGGTTPSWSLVASTDLSAGGDASTSAWAEVNTGLPTADPLIAAAGSVTSSSSTDTVIAQSTLGVSLTVVSGSKSNVVDVTIDGHVVNSQSVNLNFWDGVHSVVLTDAVTGASTSYQLTFSSGQLTSAQITSATLPTPPGSANMMGVSLPFQPTGGGLPVNAPVLTTPSMHGQSTTPSWSLVLSTSLSAGGDASTAAWAEVNTGLPVSDPLIAAAGSVTGSSSTDTVVVQSPQGVSLTVVSGNGSNVVDVTIDGQVVNSQSVNLDFWDGTHTVVLTDAVTGASTSYQLTFSSGQLTSAQITEATLPTPPGSANMMGVSLPFQPIPGGLTVSATPLGGVENTTLPEPVVQNQGTGNLLQATTLSVPAVNTGAPITDYSLVDLTSFSAVPLNP